MLTLGTIADEVGFSSLDFETVNVRCISTAGTPYLRAVRYGVPKISPKMLRCVVFLYREDAFVGTGFIVRVPSPFPNAYFHYFVSNHHVIKKGGSTVRVPLKRGGFDIFEFDDVEWNFLPEYDIAVIDAVLTDQHDAAAIPIDTFLTEEMKVDEEIGPGDNVFMIGRFIDHKSAEKASVRFGNISMDPAPITQANGFDRDSYCIDMHSRSGYSGSPVFVYRTVGADLTFFSENNFSYKNSDERTKANFHLSMLGIHWGQFPETFEVSETGEMLRESADEALVTGNRYITGLSGMTCVLPAWSILGVLNMPKLVATRDAAIARFKQDGSIPIPEAFDQSADQPKSVDGDTVLGRMLSTPPKAKV